MDIRLLRKAGRAVTAVGAFGALALLGAACDDDELPTYVQELVAPPGVPEAHPRGEARVIINLEAVEQDVEIAPGVVYNQWTFNQTVPGPMLRARVGDTIEVHLKNPSTSKVSHNVDLHAATGPGGGAGVTTVAPGEEKAFTFKAKSPGLFVYHCAAGIVADHIANGMYGGIYIERGTGLPEVDHEYYIGQSEFYTTGDAGDKGQQDLDFTKLSDEHPTYVVFNGNTKAVAGDNALQAKVGDSVRLFVANGGPNLVSSFHVIGEIFDRAWDYGATGSPPLEGVQTILVPPGGATVTEFEVDVPGDYKLVDHAIIRVSKGALGTLHVEGDENPDIFNSLSGVTGAAATGHDMAPVTTTPAATKTAAPTAAPTRAAPTAAASSNGNLKVLAKDNFFEPKTFTLKVGEEVTFELDNVGKVPHNMRIAQPDGNYDGPGSVVTDPEIVGPGKSGTLTFKPATAGKYDFRCDIHPVEMVGTLTVQ